MKLKKIKISFSDLLEKQNSNNVSPISVGQESTSSYVIYSVGYAGCCAIVIMGNEFSYLSHIPPRGRQFFYLFEDEIKRCLETLQDPKIILIGGDFITFREIQELISELGFEKNIIARYCDDSGHETLDIVDYTEQLETPKYGSKSVVVSHESKSIYLFSRSFLGEAYKFIIE